ncbi:hypothetical protein AB0E25_35990 [Streptomyces bobili]|uniref:hypothetical protein n=1 Tax=Streptomyces bobili TaxID=67280 RepID=UPI0033EA76C4
MFLLGENFIPARRDPFGRFVPSDAARHFSHGARYVDVTKREKFGETVLAAIGGQETEYLRAVKTIRDSDTTAISVSSASRALDVTS